MDKSIGLVIIVWYSGTSSPETGCKNGSHHGVYLQEWDAASNIAAHISMHWMKAERVFDFFLKKINKTPSGLERGVRDFVTYRISCVKSSSICAWAYCSSDALVRLRLEESGSACALTYSGNESHSLTSASTVYTKSSGLRFDEAEREVQLETKTRATGDDRDDRRRAGVG